MDVDVPDVDKVNVKEDKGCPDRFDVEHNRYEACQYCYDRKDD